MANAFYWRENYALSDAPASTPIGTRRSKEQIEVLRARVRELRAQGLGDKAIADRLQLTRGYVYKLR